MILELLGLKKRAFWCFFTQMTANFVTLVFNFVRLGPPSPPPPHLLKKNPIKLGNTHFQIKGIFDGIRVLDWRNLPKHPNLLLVHFDPISHGKPQNDYLYKTVLSRRLLRFHRPGDVVYAQTMETFLSRFLNVHGLYGIVDNIKKFQEFPRGAW